MLGCYFDWPNINIAKALRHVPNKQKAKNGHHSRVEASPLLCYNHELFSMLLSQSSAWGYIIFL